MPTVTLVTLTEGQLRARFDGLTRYLDHWGDVQPTDLGRQRGTRLVEFELVAPGGGLSPEVRALYREYYRLRRGDWQIAKYTYEYLDLVRGWRLAYHMHRIGGRVLVPHAHCQPSVDIPESEDRDHLRAIEYDLREAHHEFMRLWAAEKAPDCEGFLPLEVRRA